MLGKRHWFGWDNSEIKCFSSLKHWCSKVYFFFKCKGDRAHSNQGKDNGQVWSNRQQINLAQLIPLQGLKTKSKWTGFISVGSRDDSGVSIPGRDGARARTEAPGSNPHPLAKTGRRCPNQASGTGGNTTVSWSNYMTAQRCRRTVLLLVLIRGVVS